MVYYLHHWFNLTNRSVHKNSIVQFCWSGSDVNGLHLFKASQWMTFRNELIDGSLVENSSDQEDDIVNHVTVPTEQQHNVTIYEDYQFTVLC